MAEKKELKQTKSSFKLIGKVSRIDKDNAYREDESTKGKNEGKTYRSLRFGVKTSDTNENFVQIFAFEPEEVFLWNSDKAKEAKDKNQKYKGERIPFDEWIDREDELREEGFAVLQSRIGLNYGEDGKIKSKGLPSFVASKEIYDSLNNGDSVVVEGNISYSTYTNQQDKVVLQKNLNIEKVFRLKDVDFEDEKFEEVSYFEQEMVFVDAMEDKKEGKVFVTGRMIDYGKNFIDSNFVINYLNKDGEVDEDMKKLGTAFLKKIKFGDLLKVHGNVVNRVIVGEVEDDEEDEKDDYASMLGGKKKPQHAQKFASRTYVSEMEIEGVEDWQKKVYSESDFVKDDLLDGEGEKDELRNELGGKSKKKDKNNPFADDVDDDVFSDELGDDLPF